MSYEEPFQRMVARIVHSQSSQTAADKVEFAGAAVIVLPEGEPIELLMLDPKPDVAHFLSGIAMRLKELATELDRRSQQAQMYGR